MRREITSLVHETGTTALFVTHDQEEAMSMSDAIAVLSAGHLEQFATPEELYRRPRTPFGARYDVTLRHADALWHLSTDTPLAPGASVTLYVPKDAIITC